ncbi:MAG TPA: efflux RND transporter permease subunit [Agriterribacter sp.]|nr:efflux RND transporter permease subunit [Agriterribacter sp.]
MKNNNHKPEEKNKGNRFDRFRNSFLNLLGKLLKHRKPISIGYLIVITCLAIMAITFIGRDVFPKVNVNQFQLRVRAPEGTRMEQTEKIALKVLDEINGLAGKGHVAITSAMIGMHPTQYSVTPIYLFMAGSHEAVFQVALKDIHPDMDDFKDELRKRIHTKIPDLKLSFEPIDLTTKILSQGATTPIEVRVSGTNKKNNAQYAERLVDSLKSIPYLRDVQIAQSYQYPALNIDIDRTKAAQLGVDMNDISRSLIASTSSSRYTEKNMWVDEKSGQAYNVQVQIPTADMNQMSDISQIPLLNNQTRPILGDVASLTKTTTNGENDDIGTLPYLSVTANIDHNDLGDASKDVQKVINSLGNPPRGLFVEQTGLGTVLSETLSSLEGGLFVAIVVIFLMLSANFQSFKVPLSILAAIPAVILGSLILLLLTGSTLNLQSYMGIIMSVGVSIANAVLLVTNAEQIRKKTGDALEAAKEAAALRIRPIIMTAVAMVVGMLPMAIGHGDGGEQAAPLGRAVIGGLLFSTIAVLVILPLVYSWIQNKASIQSVSLFPDDEQSKYFDNHK